MKMMYIAEVEVRYGGRNGSLEIFEVGNGEDLEKVRKELENNYDHNTKNERKNSEYRVVGYEYPDDVDFEDWSDEQMCMSDPKYYEVCFEKWYAVQENTDDSWSYGSFDLEEAKRMLAGLKEAGQEEALIAVIQNDVCIEEIRE